MASYHHTIKQLIDRQARIEKHAAKEGVEIPADLAAKAKACAEWLAAHDEKISDGQVPVQIDSIAPVEDYANALFTDQNLFGEKVKDELVEFNELTKQLFQLWKEPEPTVRD